MLSNVRRPENAYKLKKGHKIQNIKHILRKRRSEKRYSGMMRSWCFANFRRLMRSISKITICSASIVFNFGSPAEWIFLFKVCHHILNKCKFFHKIIIKYEVMFHIYFIFILILKISFHLNKILFYLSN